MSRWCVRPVPSRLKKVMIPVKVGIILQIYPNAHPSSAENLSRATKPSSIGS